MDHQEVQSCCTEHGLLILNFIHIYSSEFIVRELVDLQFYMYVLQIDVCPVVLFLLVIVLSVLLRFTPSDYLCGIFKFFLLPIVYVYFFIQKQQMNIVLIQYKNFSLKTAVHFCQIFDQIVVVVVLYLDDLFAIHLCCVQQYML